MPTLAELQAALTPWAQLRGASGTAESVGKHLLVLLLVDDDAADEAYEGLEETAESQGRLYECAPAVVAVIAAAVAEGVVPAANLAPVLDLLGRILGGIDADSEAAAGVDDLRVRCHREALRSYWTFVRLARERDPFNAYAVARAVLRVLDEERTRDLLSS